MAEPTEDLGHWSNRHFTQLAAVIMGIIGFVTADAYSLAAGIAVWTVAAVFLVGSFVIEKDLSPGRWDGDDAASEASVDPDQGTT
jgi:hypothetical protein